MVGRGGPWVQSSIDLHTSIQTVKIPSLHFSRFSLAPIGLALCTTLLSVAPAHAVPYTEMGDAGDLPSTVQIVSGVANTSLTSINGTLDVVNGISGGDMFQIFISTPGSFSATTNFFMPGVNNFDTQLFLFTTTGMGIIANDDDPNGGSQSTLPAGSFTLAAGLYDLLITGSSRYAASTAGAIFPNFEDASGSDPTGVYGPTGPGGNAALSTYTGSSNEGGAYSIRLTGAQFVAAAVTTTVPEPSTIMIFGSGFALLLVALRRRAVLPLLNASVSPL